jgi:predicted house-cleaning noncanonical NTP pyrophosphatase (MazG superfamily)
MIIYNKAVRDRIPEIIEAQGKDYNVVVLNDEEFLEALENKLIEELEEYQREESVIELCDIIEVAMRIAEIKNVSNEELDTLRVQKNKERGSFKENLFLISVKD